MDDTINSPQTSDSTNIKQPNQLNSVPQANDQPIAASTVSETHVDGSKIPEPQEPVGSAAKELGPTNTTGAKEYITPSQPEIKLAQELKEAGVTPAPNIDQPPITPAPKQSPQLTLAKESVPVQTKPQGIVQFPMQEDKAVEVVKASKPRESIRWLATLILEQVKKAHKLIKS